jgi:hypothetical protein
VLVLAGLKGELAGLDGNLFRQAVALVLEFADAGALFRGEGAFCDVSRFDKAARFFFLSAQPFIQFFQVLSHCVFLEGAFRKTSRGPP